MWLRVLTLLGVLGQATNSVWKIHAFKRGSTKIYWARREWRHAVLMSSESWAKKLRMFHNLCLNSLGPDGTALLLGLFNLYIPWFATLVSALLLDDMLLVNLVQPCEALKALKWQTTSTHSNCGLTEARAWSCYQDTAVRMIWLASDLPCSALFYREHCTRTVWLHHLPGRRRWKRNRNLQKKLFKQSARFTSSFAQAG